MYEVKIVAEFTTGTTCSDQKEAEQQCQRILLSLLKKNDVAKVGMDSGAIFAVRVVDVQSEKI